MLLQHGFISPVYGMSTLVLSPSILVTFPALHYCPVFDHSQRVQTEEEGLGGFVYHMSDVNGSLRVDRGGEGSQPKEHVLQMCSLFRINKC